MTGKQILRLYRKWHRANNQIRRKHEKRINRGDKSRKKGQSRLDYTKTNAIMVKKMCNYLIVGIWCCCGDMLCRHVSPQLCLLLRQQSWNENDSVWDVWSVGIFGQTGLDRLLFLFGRRHQTLVVGCYGIYCLTAWYPMRNLRTRKFYDQGTPFFPSSTLFSRDFHFKLLCIFPPPPLSLVILCHLCSLSFQDHWSCVQVTPQDQGQSGCTPEQHNLKVKEVKEGNDFKRQRQQTGRLNDLCLSRLNAGEQHSSGAAPKTRKAGRNTWANCHGHKSRSHQGRRAGLAGAAGAFRVTHPSLWDLPCCPPLQVFLENHPQAGENIRMITDEVSQIQEVSPWRIQDISDCRLAFPDHGVCSFSGSQVRYCLKTLREQMAARQSNNNNKVNRVHGCSFAFVSCDCSCFECASKRQREVVEYVEVYKK